MKKIDWDKITSVMRVNECYLAWLPNTNYCEVLPFGQKPKQGAWTGLGAYTNIRKMDFQERKTMVLITAMQLIIRDKVEPMAVHTALLALDEYRDGLADDMPGLNRKE